MPRSLVIEGTTPKLLLHVQLGQSMHPSQTLGLHRGEFFRGSALGIKRSEELYERMQTNEKTAVCLCSVLSYKLGLICKVRGLLGYSSEARTCEEKMIKGKIYMKEKRRTANVVL